MTRTELQAASDALRAAAEAADDPDLEERLYEQSRQLATLATADRGPDHGRLARHENAFHEIIEDAEEAVASYVGEALEDVQTYREGVEGV